MCLASEYPCTWLLSLRDGVMNNFSFPKCTEQVWSYFIIRENHHPTSTSANLVMFHLLHHNSIIALTVLPFSPSGSFCCDRTIQATCSYLSLHKWHIYLRLPSTSTSTPLRWQIRKSAQVGWQICHYLGIMRKCTVLFARLYCESLFIWGWICRGNLKLCEGKLIIFTKASKIYLKAFYQPSNWQRKHTKVKGFCSIIAILLC